MTIEQQVLAAPWVVFTDVWKSTPIFHASGGLRYDVDDEGRRRAYGVTRCGLRDDGTYSRTMLRPDHALRFGRPCGNCWPGGRLPTTSTGGDDDGRS